MFKIFTFFIFISLVFFNSFIAYAENNPSKYPKCNKPDIILANGQIWSACNVGTMVAGTTKKSYGKYYQWGRNVILDASVMEGPITYADGHYYSSFVIGDTDNSFDWMKTRTDFAWGNSNGTMYIGDFNYYNSDLTKKVEKLKERDPMDKTLMQGPCALGYHVPTEKEWCDAIHSVFKEGALDSDCFNHKNMNVFSKKLLLPLAGSRFIADGKIQATGIFGFYWTSGISDVYAMGITLSKEGNGIGSIANSRAEGASIRCLKN